MPVLRPLAAVTNPEPEDVALATGRDGDDGVDRRSDDLLAGQSLEIRRASRPVARGSSGGAVLEAGNECFVAPQHPFQSLPLFKRLAAHRLCELAHGDRLRDHRSGISLGGSRQARLRVRHRGGCSADDRRRFLVHARL